MTFEEIRQTIVGRMVTFTGIEQSRIEYPNQPQRFDPPETGLWCRLGIQHGTSFFSGVGDKPCTRKPGLIVIQCFARLQTGTRALNELASALEVHFAYWSQGKFECWEASQLDIGSDATAGDTAGSGFYQINVNIRFVAD
ncbi:hypothetical protein [Shewanella algae]